MATHTESFGGVRCRLAEVLAAIRAEPGRRSLVEQLLRDAVRSAAAAAVSGAGPGPLAARTLREELLVGAARAVGLTGSLKPGVLRRLLLQADRRDLVQRTEKIHKGRHAEAHPESQGLVREIVELLEIRSEQGYVRVDFNESEEHPKKLTKAVAAEQVVLEASSATESARSLFESDLNKSRSDFHSERSEGCSEFRRHAEQAAHHAQYSAPEWCSEEAAARVQAYEAKAAALTKELQAKQEELEIALRAAGQQAARHRQGDELAHSLTLQATEVQRAAASAASQAAEQKFAEAFRKLKVTVKHHSATEVDELVILSYVDKVADAADAWVEAVAVEAGLTSEARGTS
jgi:hypothetical protein